MSLITRTLPAIMNGVSQQPAILRSADQTESEINTWSHTAEGLSRRPATQVIKKITGLGAAGSYSIHHINRDVTERYLVIIGQNLLRVFDEATGNEKTVTFPAGKPGLGTSGDVYRAVTVADYTFIINSTVSPDLDAVAADQSAQPATNVWLGGTAPRDYTPGPIGYIEAGFSGQYDPNPTYAGGLTGTVPSMDKLPDPPCSGCVYKVLGQGDTAFVSYYVMGDGVVWNETVKPGLPNAIDEATMPCALVRKSDGTFSYAPFSWKPRRVGDEITNPVPPFIGRTIRDIFFYQNRLGFAVDDGVVFSAAGDLGDFWRRTVLDYIDSDTVAASAATTDVAILDYALPYSDGVLLFSRQKQLALSSGDGGLSAHSLSITPVTNYLMAPSVRPTPMGSQAHFLAEARGFVSVKEYTRLAGSNPTEAADITAHVPHFIPKGATQLIPLPDLNALVVLNGTSTTRQKAYVYQFFWDGNKKLLSAWRVWDFGNGKPISGAYESGNLILLMERPDGTYLEKIDLSPEAVAVNQTHPIYLDRQISVNGTYNAGTNRTTFALGYTPDMSTLQIIRGTGFTAPESVISPAGYIAAGTSVSVPGNESGHPVTIGQVYSTSVEISQQFPLDWQNRPLTTGRLQLHTFTVNLTDTAYIRAEVYPYGAAAQALEAGLIHTTEFSPRVLWSAAAVLGQKTYDTAPFTFSVAGSATEAKIVLVNDTAFDSTLTSAQWEGLFFSRAQA